MKNLTIITLLALFCSCNLPAIASSQEPNRQEKNNSGSTESKTETQEQADQQKEAAKDPSKSEDTGSKGTGSKEAASQDDSKQNGSKSESETTGLDEQPERDNTPTPIDWTVKGVKELNFDHMKFNIQPDEKFQIKQLTADLIKLRGHKIRIRGYIRPAFKSEGITNFILVRDNQECCFGPGAALYDCMIVNLDDGESTDFSTRPITVEGTFQLKPYRIGKQIMAILNLKDAKVE